jgi:hypothetical protein
MFVESCDLTPLCPRHAESETLWAHPTDKLVACMKDQATDIGVLEAEITSNRATLTAYPDYVVACNNLADPLRRMHARTGNINPLNNAIARESRPARLEALTAERRR